MIGPGVLNSALVDHLVANRHTLVMWNLVCEDWKRPDGSWVDRALDGIRSLDWAVLVLHDVDSGAMSHLDRFLDLVAELDVAVVAGLPPDQVPIERGIVRGSIDHLLVDG